jgi:cytochrome c2
VEAASRLTLHRTRQSATDLEIGGELTGVPRGETRFVTYRDLAALPQESYRVTDDPNFDRPVQIGGVALDKLPGLLGAASTGDMMIAICDDRYDAHYPATYLEQHHPLLVLHIDGKPPAEWPKGSGPYMVSHPSFKPAFRVLSHVDEAQVPWGVVRLDLRDEATVYAAIEPRGPHAKDAADMFGYAIARQNCFRCHSNAGEGGEKSGRSWGVVARRSVADPQYFDDYVRNPKKLNPASEMAASPGYDDATLAALRAYFKEFSGVRP